MHARSQVFNYNHLYYFHVAAREGSIAAAATALGVTQPTVSEQLRTLERTLSVALFDRTPAGLRLTEAGRITAEVTATMFRASERLADAFGSAPSDSPRWLHVGISAAVSRATAADFLMPLLDLQGCTPSIRTGEQLDLLRELKAGALDLILTEAEPPAAARDGLQIVPLAHVGLVAIAAPGTELASDWHGTGLLHYRASVGYHWEVEAFLAEHGLRPHVVGESDDSMFLVEAAARGTHVAFVPRLLVRDAITSGRVRVVGRLEAATAQVYAIYSDRVAFDTARAAVDALLARVLSMAE